MPTSDTPMMRQYQEIKGQHQDSVLFFRMGDFYEMFFEDAEEISRLLNLTLTKRQGVPMCGIPYHAAQNYLARLLQFGKRIAICEQTENPQAGRGITKREVVEIVSPGTVLQENFLQHGANNYLQAFCKLGQMLGMALLDFSTGEFVAGSFQASSPELRGEILQRELLLASSRELLLMEELHDEFSNEFWGQSKQTLCNRIPAWCFAPDSAERKLCGFFGVQSLKGFGFDEGRQLDMAHDAALGAAWVLIEYLQQNRLQVLPHIQQLLPLRRSEQLQLDSAALRNLEIFQNMQNGSRDYTLFQVLHDCQSAMGSRCLHRWLRQPVLQPELLELRYDRTEVLLGDGLLRSSVRGILGKLSDLERIISRIATGKANARDLIALRNSLGLYEEILAKLQGAAEPQLCSLFLDGAEVAQGSEQTQAQRECTGGSTRGLQDLLEISLAEAPPAVLHEGGMIAEGYSADLDELHTLQKDRRKILDAYVAKEQRQVGSTKLKLKYNRIIGYYFEISKSQAIQASLPNHFIRRQSLVNGERYSTEELSELESKLSSADEQVVQLERQLFTELLQKVLPYSSLVLKLAQALAELDVLANFAELALRHNYARPELHESGAQLDIEGGRHPVVEQYLHNENFVPNKLSLSKEAFLALITGPNMAGKSTYLRQNALIVLMAQIGCFVPAKRACIPIVDRIFCRVGASDNLSRGESTFMVEMQETARILNEASSQSLVIMDEVGRGTSTLDGLAIAQSICEYILQKIHCMTLFATHYHELTELQHPQLKLLCLAVDESGEKIRFRKHVEEGAIASSYGIHVAALAGIPPVVTQRAAEILEKIQGRDPSSPGKELLGEPRDVEQNLAQSQACELYEMQADRQDLAIQEIQEPPPSQDLVSEAEQTEANLFSDILAPEDTEKMSAARSRQAQQSGQLFSEADLLFDELQDLGKIGLAQLDGKEALRVLRQWMAKYL